MQLQKKLSDAGIEVDGVYTIDSTPRKSEERSTEIGDNVVLNQNYYQRTSDGGTSVGGGVKGILNLHGGPNFGEGSSTTVTNINMTGETYEGKKITHYNIDGATMGKVVTSILGRTESSISAEALNRITRNLERRLREVEDN